MTAIAPSQADGLAANCTNDAARWETLLRWAMIGVAILLTAGVLIRTAASWMTWGDIEHTSGTWIAMAADARAGVLYRPIVSNVGYGGTRYAPLHALLQAGLLKLGMGYLASGFFLEAISTVMILWASWMIMRRLGVTPVNAFCFTCYILAAAGMNETIASNKADLLAAGLSLWGVVSLLYLLPWYSGGGTRWGLGMSQCAEKMVRSADPTRNPHPGPPPAYDSTELVAGQGRGKEAAQWLTALVAGIFFVLAFDTKVTSIFGLAAGMIWLWRQGGRRFACLIAVVWILGIGLSMVAIEWASDGRALAVFRACAAGGGGIGDFLRGPLYLAANGLAFDKTAVFLWALAMVILFGTGRRQWGSLAGLLLIISTLGTIAIFGTPGININHLIDLNAAVLIFLAVQWHRTPARWVFTIFLVALLGWQSVTCFRQAANLWRHPPRAQLTAALADADASPTPGPLLSENALLPLLDGQQPYLLDSFMLRVINKNRPELSQKFWDDLSHRRFRAVVLTHSPTWNRVYNENNFGPGFIQKLQESYELKSSHGDYYVFWPRKN